MVMDAHRIFFQVWANYGSGSESPPAGPGMEPRWGSGPWGKAPKSRRQGVKIMHK